MSTSGAVRQVHRWVSLVFSLLVVGNVSVMSAAGGQAPPWLTMAPLAPLLVLLVSGLYLFVQPYFPRRRGPQRGAAAPHG